MENLIYRYVSHDVHQGYFNNLDTEDMLHIVNRAPHGFHYIPFSSGGSISFLKWKDDDGARTCDVMMGVESDTRLAADLIFKICCVLTDLAEEISIDQISSMNSGRIKHRILSQELPDLEMDVLSRNVVEAVLFQYDRKDKGDIVVSSEIIDTDHFFSALKTIPKTMIGDFRISAIKDSGNHSSEDDFYNSCELHIIHKEMEQIPVVHKHILVNRDVRYGDKKNKFPERKYRDFSEVLLRFYKKSGRPAPNGAYILFKKITSNQLIKTKNEDERAVCHLFHDIWNEEKSEDVSNTHSESVKDSRNSKRSHNKRTHKRKKKFKKNYEIYRLMTITLLVLVSTAMILRRSIDFVYWSSPETLEIIFRDQNDFTMLGAGLLLGLVLGVYIMYFIQYFRKRRE